MRKTIVRAIEETTDVSRLLHMRTQHIGPDELLVAAKIQLKAGMDTARVAAAINQTERRIREAVPIPSMIYLEPDVFDADHPDIVRG
jgi:divalent metal cation (Fe/Co/Zn/Cd) transporter